MKKTLLIIGIILLAAAVICFGISFFFHWMATSVMDGSAELYARLFRRSHIFLLLGAVLSIPGIVMLVVSIVTKNN